MESRLSLLLIDDDASIRRLCSRMLSRMGFTLLEAACGAAGRELFTLHAEQLCAVLLDMNLPDIPGVALKEEFAATHPDVPVIFFTGSTTVTESSGQDGRTQYFLKKPFTRGSLEETLQKVGVTPPSPAES